MATPGFTPEVDAILATLIPGVQTALADNLVGVYLRGSLATGDFIDTSDIDFVVATERLVSDAEAETLIAMHARLAALPNLYANLLEGAYIDRAALRRFEPGQRFLTIECETALRWQEHGPHWTLERWTLREHGVALVGPEPRTLIEPISPDELREAVRRRVRGWGKWARQPEPGWQWPDGEWLSARGHQAYVIETMCRALYTLEFGELESKARSVAWTLGALPKRWKHVVDSLAAARADTTEDPATIPKVLSFIEWVAQK
jgi:predicted nucleotidyltransferase